jgi:hypothetical protein
MHLPPSEGETGHRKGSDERYPFAGEYLGEGAITEGEAGEHLHLKERETSSAISAVWHARANDSMRSSSPDSTLEVHKMSAKAETSSQVHESSAREWGGDTFGVSGELSGGTYEARQKSVQT